MCCPIRECLMDWGSGAADMHARASSLLTGAGLGLMDLGAVWGLGLGVRLGRGCCAAWAAARACISTCQLKIIEVMYSHHGSGHDNMTTMAIIRP